VKGGAYIALPFFIDTALKQLGRRTIAASIRKINIQPAFLAR
jgi:hypothetical protein